MGAEYKYQVGEVVNETLKIVEQIRVNDSKKKKDGTNYTKKGYIVQSTVYPNAPVYEVSEYSLKSGKGCAYIRGLRVFEGNSLWSLIEYRKYIINEEEAKSITPKSNKKIKLRCDNCSNEKMMRVSGLVNQGLACSTCSSNTPYPELLFNAYNQVKGLKFTPQQRFRNFTGYIFDFVNYETRTIVEVHGEQHYDEDNKWYKRTHKSDIAKREYCKKNGWNFVELDCSKSTFEFIKNQIELNEALPNITNKDEKLMLKIIKQNKRYPIKKIIKMYNEGLSTTQIGEEFRVAHTTISRILRRNNIKLRNGEKQVRCINTNQIFSSVKEAEKVLNIKNISGACRAKIKSAGKHPITGEPLRWEYVDNE